MHMKNSPEYRHHLETYGDPSEFGYHDFVPMFIAERFDADEWADLFKKAGARFAGPVAEHHDGFSMWASKLTPWNVKDKGPRRDITGEIARAIHARGLRLFTSFHHARNNQHRIIVDGYLKWTGHYPRIEGWPTISEDPELRMLYGNLPRRQFLNLWLGKLREVIDNYQPDIIWFDSWLDEIPIETRQEFSAYYLNCASEWGKDVVITRKQDDLPLEYTVMDIEKGRMRDVTEEVWLTDDTISNGSWCYTEGLTIKPSSQVLHSLIDIVSKNGVLVLNISPKSDGTIPDDQKAVLLDIGQWLETNGEAVYGTRPWLTFGEGPTDRSLPRGTFGGVTDPKGGYNWRDIRYTWSKDEKYLYAISLGNPESRAELLLTAFAQNAQEKALKVSDVLIIGSNVDIKWEHRNDGLSIIIPDSVPQTLASVFRIEFDN
jgi:alpha-L-fucosidase